MFSFIFADPNDVLFCKLQTQPLFFSALFLHCNLTNTIIKGHFRYWKCSVDAGRDGYLGKWQESSKLKNKIQSSLKISKSFLHCLFTWDNSAEPSPTGQQRVRILCKKINLFIDVINVESLFHIQTATVMHLCRGPM